MIRCAFLLPLISYLPLHAGDPTASWPQWQGPTRDNNSPEKKLLADWPPQGPKLLWKIADLGDGYSTPTIDHGRIFGLSYRDDDEIVWARTLDNGKPLWTRKIAQANREVDYHQGSRSSATIDGEMLYALGVSGDLVCLRVANGEIVWQKNLIRDFGGILPFYRESYGYSESPLVDGDLLLVTPGGEKHTVIALHKKTGKHVWSASVPTKKKGDNRAAYSSLVAGEIDGVKQYAQYLQGCVVGVSNTGNLLWRWDKPSNDIANCTTPIFVGDLVFASSGYGKGCGLAQVVMKGKDATITEKWFNKAMKNVHGGIVLVDGHVYGNSDPGMLVCVELATGKAKWQERSAGKGSILYADGRLYYRAENGPMLLIEANAKEYVERGRFDPPHRSKYNAWAHPVLAGGRLYLRDQEHLLCYDIFRR